MFPNSTWKAAGLLAVYVSTFRWNAWITTGTFGLPATCTLAAKAGLIG
jgi:hypothetical protein